MDQRLKVFLTSLIVSILVIVVFFSKPKNDPIISKVSPRADVAPMPLVLDTDPITASYRGMAPYENRGPEVKKYLSVSLKVLVSGSSGSGTIVYYDRATGYAYVASCGHLWGGTRSAQSLSGRQIKCRVEAWYENENKMPSSKRYPGEVLFWSNDRGYDSSLIRFKPDWNPIWFPIAQLDYPIKQGIELHSCGCDHGDEVAHYDVEFVGFRGNDLVTKRNSPRPGRSGGGLLTTDGYYVGICWGTSNMGGEGVGYFTPLKSIHAVYSSNGYDWLLSVPLPFAARDLPIRSNVPNKQFKPEFIPIPGGELFPIN